MYNGLTAPDLFMTHGAINKCVVINDFNCTEKLAIEQFDAVMLCVNK